MKTELRIDQVLQLNIYEKEPNMSDPTCGGVTIPEMKEMPPVKIRFMSDNTVKAVKSEVDSAILRMTEILPKACQTSGIVHLKLEVALEHNRRASEMLADITGNGGQA